MSNSLESKNPNFNAGGAPSAPNPATGSPAPANSVSAFQQPPVVLPPKATDLSVSPSAKSGQAPNSASEFTTKNIGHWASRQENYFAEQNRKAEEKRKKSERTRKKVLPIIFIVGGIIAAGLIIWGIVALIVALNTPEPGPDTPTIAGGTSEDVNGYRDILQEFFDRDGGNNIAAVEEAVNNTLETESGKEYADQVRLAELYILQNNGYYAEAIEKAQNVNTDNLDLSQKITFYGVLYYCNTLLGNIEAANEYMKIQYDLSQEQGGQGGGGA